MGVLSVLKTSGSLPINELNVMTAGSPDELLHELDVLHRGDLVKFDGELPAPDAVPTAHVTVSLTKAGLKQSLA